MKHMGWTVGLVTGVLIANDSIAADILNFTADTDGNGIINVNDLLALLAGLGPCP